MSASVALVVATPLCAQTNGGAGAIERTIPKELPKASVAPTIVAPRPDVQAQGPVTGTFILGAVHVQGATVFSQALLSQDFEPYLATEVDEVRLKEIAARITTRYRKAGYLLSYAIVPAQDVRAGIVRIVVVEGLVTKVEVKGAGQNKAALEAIAAPLLKNRPLRNRELERVIGLVRDLSGIIVADVGLSRSETEPAKHVLKIVVARDTVRALGYADNRGTDRAGRQRFYTSLSMSSLMSVGDELRVDLFGIPGKDYRYVYGQVSAILPLGRDGLKLGLSTSAGDQYQRTNGNRIDSESTSLTAQLGYPVLRSRALTAVAKVSINDWRSINELDRIRNQRDRLRIARIGVELSNDATTRFGAEFTLSQGLGLGGVTRAGDLLASRSDASGRFTKGAFTLQVAQPVSEKATLQFVMAGQYSRHPLLSVEEFAVGGSRIGRAYDFNALTGDHGIAGALELGYRIGDLGQGPKRIELFAYLDGGAAFQVGSLSGVPKSRSLSSIGVGNRFSIAGISVSVEVGIPLSNEGLRNTVRGFLSAYKAF